MKTSHPITPSFPAASPAVATDLSSTGLTGHIQAALAAGCKRETALESNMKRRIKLLLVDDHPVVRKGISSCLAKQEHLQIIGEAADGKEALRKAHELNPDIMLVDIDMPQMDGLAVTEVLRKQIPKIKVLILSMHSNTDYVMRIIQSGASGYILKEAPTEELVRAIAPDFGSFRRTLREHLA